MTDDLVKRGSVIAAVNLCAELARVSGMRGHKTLAMVTGEIVKIIEAVPASDELTALPAVQPHVNETPKSEHEAAVMLTPATKGGE